MPSPPGVRECARNGNGKVIVVSHADHPDSV
jgi:hypothetical protein